MRASERDGHGRGDAWETVAHAVVTEYEAGGSRARILIDTSPGADLGHNLELVGRISTPHL